MQRSNLLQIPLDLVSQSVPPKAKENKNKTKHHISCFKCIYSSIQKQESNSRNWNDSSSFCACSCSRDYVVIFYSTSRIRVAVKENDGIHVYFMQKLVCSTYPFLDSSCATIYGFHVLSGTARLFQAISAHECSAVYENRWQSGAYLFYEEKINKANRGPVNDGCF